MKEDGILVKDKKESVVSISKRDLNMVIGCVIMTTVLVTIGNLVIDIIYAFVDPRIRSSYTGK